MRKCPKSRWENEDGLVDWEAVRRIPESPDVIAWEKEYETQCDMLSAKLALKYPRHWGRWFLADGCLGTHIARPAVGKHSAWTAGVYDIEVSRIGPNGESDGNKSYTWQRHLSEKVWLGEQGIKDFTLAAKALHEKGQ